MSTAGWVVVCILGFFAIVVAGVVVQERSEAGEMRACVAAGKDWVHKYGSVYECVEVKG